MSEVTKFIQQVKPVYVTDDGTVVKAPNLSLPYDWVEVRARNTGAIANLNNEVINFTAANWGAGTDFYVYSIQLTLNMQVNMMINNFEGAFFYAEHVDGGTDPWFWTKTISAVKDQYPRLAANGFGYFTCQDQILPHRVPVGDNINISMYNATGQAVNANTWTIYLIGVII